MKHLFAILVLLCGVPFAAAENVPKAYTLFESNGAWQIVVDGKVYYEGSIWFPRPPLDGTTYRSDMFSSQPTSWKSRAEQADQCGYELNSFGFADYGILQLWINPTNGRHIVLLITQQPMMVIEGRTQYVHIAEFDFLNAGDALCERALF